MATAAWTLSAREVGGNNRLTDDADSWKFHPLNFGSGGAEMGVYDVNGDGLNDVVTSIAAHGWGLAWFEQKRDGAGAISFVQHAIMGDFSGKNAGNVTFSELHGMTFGDMDGDGIPDIMVGSGTGRTSKVTRIPIHTAPLSSIGIERCVTPKAEGGAEFVPELIHNRSGVGSHLAAVDLNNDGAVGYHHVYQQRHIHFLEPDAARK